MAAITPYEYHSDSKNHGSYQYVSLLDIINEFELESMGEDSSIKNEKRYRIVETAKNSLRTLNKDVFNDVRAIQITVPENPSFVLPNDFVDYVRISKVTYDQDNGGYTLKPLNVNYDISFAVGYLQDHNKEIIFDGNGDILATDHLNAYHRPYKKYGFTEGRYTKRTSENGDFNIDQRRGRIAFSSDLSEQEVVIEYLSDGLSKDIFGNEDIKVHKNVIQVLKDHIYYSLIEYKRGIPQSEKARALRRFYTTKHEANIESLNFSIAKLQRTKNL